MDIRSKGDAKEGKDLGCHRKPNKGEHVADDSRQPSAGHYARVKGSSDSPVLAVALVDSLQPPVEGVSILDIGHLGLRILLTTFSFGQHR